MPRLAAYVAIVGCAILLQGQGAAAGSKRKTQYSHGYKMKGQMGKWVFQQKRDPDYGYYMLTRDRLTAARMGFDEAVMACKDLDPASYPTTISDKYEHKFLIEMIPNNRHGFWVGAVMKADASGFKNIDGSMWGQRTYQPWATSEPRADGFEHCIFSGFNNGDPSKYNDAACQAISEGSSIGTHRGKRVICKKHLKAQDTTATSTFTSVTTRPLVCAFQGFILADGKNHGGNRKKILEKFARGIVVSARACFDKCEAQAPLCTHFAFKNEMGGTCIIYKGYPTTARMRHFSAYLANDVCVTTSTTTATEIAITQTSTAATSTSTTLTETSTTATLTSNTITSITATITSSTISEKTTSTTQTSTTQTETSTTATTTSTTTTSTTTTRPLTGLSQATLIGATVLEVSTARGFQINDIIIIGDKIAGFYERRKIVGFGSIIIDIALEHAYPNGTKIRSATFFEPPVSSATATGTSTTTATSTAASTVTVTPTTTVTTATTTTELRCVGSVYQGPARNKKGLRRFELFDNRQKQLTVEECATKCRLESTGQCVGFSHRVSKFVSISLFFWWRWCFRRGICTF
jgi:hypothetical protein